MSAVLRRALTLGRTMTLAVLWVITSPAEQAAQQLQQFGDHAWSIVGDARVGTHLGREALLVRSGQAVSVDTTFRTGVIEFDVSLTANRTFTGVSFRLDPDTRSSEQFYLRPHNSGRFDAVQYTPVYNGVAAWQLYPEYNAMYAYTWDEWTPVRLEIFESGMIATIRGDTVLVVDRLTGPQGRGRVVLQSSFPAQADQPSVYPVAFSNLRITPRDGVTGHEETMAVGEEDDGAQGDGLITKWLLSEAVETPEDAASLTPPPASDEIWRAVDAEPDGRLNIARFRSLPPGSTSGTVFARVTVRSDVEQTIRMWYGFSDIGTIWLNGSRVLTADNTYLSRSGRYLGVMTSGNDSVFLPLREGDNTLVFAVSESFGGWGLVARLENEAPVDIHP